MTFRDKGFFLVSFCSLQHEDPKVDKTLFLPSSDNLSPGPRQSFLAFWRTEIQSGPSYLTFCFFILPTHLP